MTRHYPDQGSASDWSCRLGDLLQPIRSTTQIWVVTCHQYGISALVDVISRGNQWWRPEMSSVSQAKSSTVDTDNEEAKKSGHINGVLV